MIFGDPYLFAIQWDIVPTFSNSYWKNGLIHLFVGGIQAGTDPVRTEEIGTQLFQLEGLCETVKGQRSLPDEVLKKTDREIFTWLQELTFPRVDRGQVDCRDYLAAPGAVTDMNYAIFLVRRSTTERLYVGHRDNGLEGIVDLPLGEFERIVSLANEAFQVAGRRDLTDLGGR